MMRIVLLFFIALVLVPGLFAQSGVKAGDKAPALSVDEWLKGDPVNSFENGKVYLVEFWGTWCEPCIENIPHLSKLQKKYLSDGLIVIGVATHELNGRDGLEKFMDKHGSEMEYRVAYDSDYSMESDWDTGVKGSSNFRLPVCFLIDKTGFVVFSGHPSEENLEGLIEKALGN